MTNLEIRIAAIKEKRDARRVALFDLITETMMRFGTIDQDNNDDICDFADELANQIARAIESRKVA